MKLRASWESQALASESQALDSLPASPHLASCCNILTNIKYLYLARLVLLLYSSALTPSALTRLRLLVCNYSSTFELFGLSAACQKRIQCDSHLHVSACMVRRSRHPPQLFLPPACMVSSCRLTCRLYSVCVTLVVSVE